MTALFPLLEEISLQHPSDTLRQMSADLYIAIATHGAVKTASMTDLLENLGKRNVSVEERTRNLKVEELPGEQKKKATEKNKKGNGGNKGQRSKGGLLEEGLGESIIGEQSIEEEEKTAVSKKEVVCRDIQDEEEALTKRRTSLNNESDVDLDTCHEDDKVESKEFDQAFEELFDPLVPVRGHALIALTRLLQQKDPKALLKQETLLKLFLKYLTHEDSYVYLTAVGALVSLVDRFPEKVIPSLCAEYSLDKDNEDCTMSKIKRTVETRLKLGEALVKATRLLGELY